MNTSSMPKEKIFTKDFTLDSIISFCCSLNYFMLLINIAGFASVEFGADPAAGGMAAGIYVIGGLISRVFIGKYVELFGRKRMLVISLLAAALMSASYFFVSSLIMLFAVRFLHGMCYGLSSTCTSDIVAKLVPPSRRGEGLGYFFLSLTLSCAIGPLLGMTLGASQSYDTVFAIGLVMYSVALVMALILHVPEEELTEGQKAEARSFDIRNLFQVSAIPLSLMVMVFYFAYSGVLSFLAEYAEFLDIVGIASFFYVAVAIGTLVSRLSAGRIYDARGSNIVMIPGLLSFISGMVIFATTDNEMLFLGAGLLIGFGISIVYSITQSIIVAHSPPRRYGVTMSTYSAFDDLGSGIGPSILGLLITSVGFRDMYLFSAGVACLSLLMYWVIHGRREGRTPGCEIRPDTD